MSLLSRQSVLNALTKHETLVIDDLEKEENMGFLPDKEELQLLLNELTESKHLNILEGAKPCTYTITEKGIEEGKRLGHMK